MTKISKSSRSLWIASCCLSVAMGLVMESRAAEIALPAEAKRAEALANAVESYRAKFTLETKEKGGENFRVEGTILFKRPNRRRLELHQRAAGSAELAEDLSQTLVSDGTTEWQYYPKDQVVYKAATAPLAPGPHRPFSEIKPETLRFVEQVGNDPDVRLRFEGSPTLSITDGAPVPIKTLRVDVGQADGLVRELALLDEKGEAVLTQKYEDLEINPSIGDDAFNFTPPEGVSVMDVGAQGPGKPAQ